MLGIKKMWSDKKWQDQWTPISEVTFDDIISEGRYDKLLIPIFEKPPNWSHFGIFVMGYKCFLYGFRGYGQKSRIWAFVLGCSVNLNRNKLREHNNELYNREEDHYSYQKISLA